MVKRIGLDLQATGAGAKALMRESAMLVRRACTHAAWQLGEREVPAKDPRFADSAWRDNPAYRRLGQGYLAFCEAIDRVAGSSPDWRERETGALPRKRADQLARTDQHPARQPGGAEARGRDRRQAAC